jgi:hypothetical protein
MEQA